MLPRFPLDTWVMKPLVRKFISWALVHLGLLDLLIVLNRLRGRRLMILGLHRVKDPTEDPTTVGLINLYVSETNLEAVIRYLRRRFRIISMNEYVEAAAAETSMPGNCAVLTFDDGYNDFMTGAAPILSRQSAPGTLFVASGRNATRSPAWWDLAYNLLSRLTSEHRPGVADARGSGTAS